MRKYDIDFKKEAVRRVFAGQSAASVAPGSDQLEGATDARESLSWSGSKARRRIDCGRYPFRWRIKSGDASAMFQDVKTKVIVGWELSDRMKADLVGAALIKGLPKIKKRAITHTDRGSRGWFKYLPSAIG